MATRYMEYNNPVMLNNADCFKVIEKIRQKNIYDCTELKPGEMFKLVKHLAPGIDSKALDNQQRNYARAKEDSHLKLYPQIITQMFMDSLWWEQQGHWSTDKHFDINPESRYSASSRKRFRRVLKSVDDKLEEVYEAQEELENSMKQKNMISKEEHLEKMDEEKLVNKALKEDAERKEGRLLGKIRIMEGKLKIQRERYDRLNDHVYQGKPLVEEDDEDDGAGVGLEDSDHENI